MTQNTAKLQAETAAENISPNVPKVENLSSSNTDIIAKLHEEARSFLHSHGFFFEEDFEETHETEQIKFKIFHENSKKKINCWLKCSYPLRKDGTVGLCITFGAFHHSLAQHDTKTFWADSNFQLTEEERQSINERLAEGKRHADERAKEEQKISDEKADWCIEKLKNASTRGKSPYFDKKRIAPFCVFYEIRRQYSESGHTEETIALIPLRNIKGTTRALQEIYPSKRKFKEDEEPRDKNTLGKYSGCFFTFGKLEDGNPICIAEGYATAAPIFESTNTTILMVVTRTNILNVCKEINRKYPNSQIIICGDDDVDTEGNPGRTDAITAANAINAKIPDGKPKCKVVFPKFPEDMKRDASGKSFKDFHDLWFIYGKDEVKRQIDKNAFIPEIKTNLPEKIEKKREVKKIPQNGLPILKIVTGQLHNTTNYAEQILISNNLGIFQRSGQLVRIITEISKPKKNKLLDKDGKEIIKRDADALLIAEVEPIYLTELLGKHANWTKYDERTGDWVLKDCPERIAKTLIARREWNVPVLTGIIQAPTLRSNGSILETPGYDEITGLFFNSGNTSFYPIPAHPSKDEAVEALYILLEILKGFPFENEESKSVALSAILTALVRRSIRSAPLHGYTAPKMGSGKSLLADVVGLIATGKNNSVIPQAENEAEEKKRLLAVLAEGDAIICYDNIENSFGSPALCSILTQQEFKDRLLGVNRSLSVPTNATFLATGNNLTFIGDTSTRAILCRVDALCEKPEERSFDIDLRQYIPQHRAELVKAGLTILRAYHVAGRPKQNIAQYGRFEDWSDWIRSSLVWLGMADPCVSRKEIENSDPTRVSLIRLLTAWYEYLGDISYTLKNAVSKAEKEEKEKEKAENLLEAFKDFLPEKSEIKVRSLGKKLPIFKGRIENGLRLENTGKYQNADTWRVKKITQK